ncbi:hypothetical protein CTA1_7622 [Colletotrichum tanaceti]|uniref:Uncharacterized protein n=1 Tax=Colletotrichum tanaceti TaxID=1306861 RepID=A0A4U6XQZ7_9PEZI|nr:hypothetical protein CTA1_7622 [Colletotrichum tanaceti]
MIPRAFALDPSLRSPHRHLNADMDGHEAPGTDSDRPLRTPLALGILVLDGLGVLVVGAARVLLEHALLDELLGSRAVRYLVVERVGAHVLLELLLVGDQAGRGVGRGQDVFWEEKGVGAKLADGVMYAI